MSDVCRIDDCGHPVHVRKRGLCLFHNELWKKGLSMRRRMREDVHRRDDQGRKRCRACWTYKPESAFASSVGRGDGLQHTCRECKSRNYYANKEKVRDSMREQRFGLTRAEFDAMLEAQGGACAICKSDTPGPNTHWHVDHDHDCCPSSNKTCGKCVRGLLCRYCNHMLGSGRDNPDILRAGIDYLGRTSMRDAS